MEVQELKALIMKKEIPPFMIFTGDEWKVQEIYINQIAKVTGLEIKRVDAISDIWSQLNSKSLFAKNYLYLVRDDKEFMTEEKLYNHILERLHDNMLILTLTSVDKRLKMLKTYNNTTYEFNALKSEILRKYIQKEIALSDRNCDILIEVCEGNYGRILLEIDKVKQCMTGTKADDMPNNTFEMLLANGTIHIPPRDNIWTFIKAVLKNRPLEAYELYQELKELKVPTLSILSNLYTETKHVLQVQMCDSKDIAKTTGLNNWQIRNARECINIFSDEDLIYFMRLIQKVEKGIKKGLITDDIAIDYILTSFL